MTGNLGVHRFRAVSGSRFSFTALVWTLVGLLLVFHLVSICHKDNIHHGEIQSRTSGFLRRPIYHELEVIEEVKNINIPPPRGKRSSRAPKRKHHKRFSPIIEEFLDEDSQLRHVFFPNRKNSIDPIGMTGNDSSYYFPGRVWLDTDGNPIQAHGGGILHDEGSETYYWYGEYKEGPTYRAHKKGAARVDIIGVGCYSSKDLWTWKNEGIVLAAEELNATHDLHKSNVLERPKVVHNEKTGKYVMWMHIDDANYTKASAGVAVSDRPTGPFQYLGSKRPHGCDSRDMTVFKDDDGSAYIVYSSENNSVLHMGPLTENYLDVEDVMKRVLIGQHREAPALFKYRGTYYMITSGCTGWAPNEALAHAAESVMGPWETLGNPCVGANKVFRQTTFFAQSTFVFPIPGHPGLFIFMADRWNPSNLRDSRYVWLPLIVAGPPDQPLEFGFGFPLWSRVSIYWHRKWRLPSGWSTLR
ncbi:uncharacterized protein LOC116200926 isoform X2 [Punica granatum]|uniref:Uncharacterized protein LOC116200926 isoform X2 n=2 Tax=Punica granatum TaxID=22663 RepID=A0A6P8D292_PUNGR|nr:uncharacterized protein LOC116200926 isoform X2 [Punica granatum]